jgi:hypothetical protein
MAERTPTVIQPGSLGGLEHSVLMTWTGLLNGDTGAPLTFHDYPDRTFQVTGTFGTGGSVNLEGSNDGTNWAILTDPQGNAITKTAAGMEAVTETPRYMRPNVTAGDGTTDLTVTVFARSPR